MVELRQREEIGGNCTRRAPVPRRRARRVRRDRRDRGRDCKLGREGQADHLHARDRAGESRRRAARRGGHARARRPGADEARDRERLLGDRPVGVRREAACLPAARRSQRSLSRREDRSRRRWSHGRMTEPPKPTPREQSRVAVGRLTRLLAGLAVAATAALRRRRRVGRQARVERGRRPVRRDSTSSVSTRAPRTRASTTASASPRARAACRRRARPRTRPRAARNRPLEMPKRRHSPVAESSRPASRTFAARPGSVGTRERRAPRRPPRAPSRRSACSRRSPSRGPTRSTRRPSSSPRELRALDLACSRFRDDSELAPAEPLGRATVRGGAAPARRACRRARRGRRDRRRRRPHRRRARCAGSAGTATSRSSASRPEPRRDPRSCPPPAGAASSSTAGAAS